MFYTILGLFSRDFVAKCARPAFGKFFQAETLVDHDNAAVAGPGPARQSARFD